MTYVIDYELGEPRIHTTHVGAPDLKTAREMAEHPRDHPELEERIIAEMHSNKIPFESGWHNYRVLHVYVVLGAE